METSGSIKQFIGEWPPPEECGSHADNFVVSPNKHQNMNKNTSCQQTPGKAKAHKRDSSGAYKNRQHEEKGLYNADRLNHRTALSDISKWWKSYKNKCDSSVGLPSGCQGKSAVRMIARSKDGHEFLESSIVKLLEELNAEGDSAELCFLLATYYDIMGDYETAYDVFKRAKKLKGQFGDLSWHLKKCEKNLLIKEQQKAFFEAKGRVGSDVRPCFEVERRDCSSFSSEDFYENYALTNTPVIITGLANKLVEPQWTLEYVKECVGSKRSPLKVFRDWSREWAKLETEEHSGLISEFVDSILDGSQTQKYLFDWSLPLYAPELLENFKVPRYFANDFLQRTAPGTVYQDSWPSLFISPKSTVSHLHVDAFGSNFWMALFKGRKKWTFFPREDLAMLYPNYEDSMDANFDIDIFSPNLEKYPLFRFARRTECILNEGEVLFVPHGCPHQVENLDTTLAISANFVDRSNVAGVMEALACDALLDTRAGDLLAQLQSDDFPTAMNFFKDNVSWSKFKNSLCRNRQDCSE